MSRVTYYAPLWLRYFLGVFRVLGRFVAGLDLDGQRRTDATWSEPATRSLLNYRNTPTRWTALPGRTRAAVRIGVLVTVAAETYGLLRHRVLTLALSVLVAALLAVFGAWRAVRAWRLRVLRKQVIRPLQAALAHRLAQHPTARPDSWLTVPTTYRTNPETPVVIALPQGFDREAHGESVVRSALDRLAIPEPVISWHNYGPNPTVTIKARPAPPELVTLGDILRAIETGKDTDVVLGLGCGNRIVSASLLLDSPHFAISAPSNSGKSVATALIVSQQMYRGAGGIIFDIKAESHTWAFGLPNAVVFTRIEQIHSGLIAVWVEVERRQREVEKAARARQPRPTFDRLWVIAEELNMTRKALKAFWDRYREEDPQRAKLLPKTSPALDALANVSFAGRSVGVHAALIAQRLTAAATGDNTGAVRENMGVRVMIKPREKTWAMLADGASLPKFIKGVKGRAHVVIDGHAEEVQIAYLTDDEFRALAVAGTVCPVPGQFAAIESGALVIAPGHTPDPDIAAPEPERPELPPAAEEPAALAPAPAAWVTIEQAVRDGILSGDPESLKKALRRDRQRNRGPEGRIGPNGLEYDPETLAEWRDSRPRAAQREATSVRVRPRNSAESGIAEVNE